MLHAILADNFDFWLPKAASKNAGDYDALFYFILAINIIFSSLIMAVMIYFILRYRHRPGVKNNPTAGHSTALELTWTVIPTLIVLGIFYYGFKGYLHANVMPPNAYEITATGQTWSWSFTYPNGHVDPELHLWKDNPTRMVLSSPDILHDLDIPSFRMKKDVVPGRYNRQWFEPNVANPAPKPVIGFQMNANTAPPLQTVDAAGTYALFARDGAAPVTVANLEAGDTFGFQIQDGKHVAVFTAHGQTNAVALPAELTPEYVWKFPYESYDVYCAMYCGQNHSTMRARCFVHQNKGEFDAWLAEVSNWEPRESFIEHGQKLATQQGCSNCHSTNNARLTGPTWSDLYGSDVPLEGGAVVKADDAYLEESIRNPGAKIVATFPNAMPTSFANMTPNEIKALIWYMKSISKFVPKSELAEGYRVGAAMGKPATNPATAPAAP